MKLCRHRHKLHKMRNGLDRLPERMRAQNLGPLREIMHAGKLRPGKPLIEKLARSLERDYSKAASRLRDGQERMLAY